MENLLAEKEEGNVFGLNPKGLYIFTSQTGTSRTTARMMEKIQSLGLMTLSITEDEETPLAKISRIHLSMGCGKEEFPMRTIGYVSSALDHCLLAMAIGRKRGVLSLDEHEQLRKEALAAIRNRVKIQETIRDWFPKISSRLMDALGKLSLGVFIFHWPVICSLSCWLFLSWSIQNVWLLLGAIFVLSLALSLLLAHLYNRWLAPWAATLQNRLIALLKR